LVQLLTTPVNSGRKSRFAHAEETGLSGLAQVFNVEPAFERTFWKRVLPSVARFVLTGFRSKGQHFVVVVVAVAVTVVVVVVTVAAFPCCK
jgi:hypothetical protein